MRFGGLDGVEPCVDRIEEAVVNVRTDFASAILAGAEVAQAGGDVESSMQHILTDAVAGLAARLLDVTRSPAGASAVGHLLTAALASAGRYVGVTNGRRVGVREIEQLSERGTIMDTEKVLDTIAELHSLTRLPRIGWILAGVQPPERVSDHGFETALIAYILSRYMGEPVGALPRSR
jgi:hypothetical protein